MLRSKFHAIRGNVLLGLLALCLIWSGCSVSHHLSLEADRSGYMRVAVEMHPAVVDYVFEVAEVVYGTPIRGEERRLFDLSSLEATLGGYSSVELTSAEIPAPNAIEFTVAFELLDAVIAELEAVSAAGMASDDSFPLLFSSRADGSWLLRLYLTASNFRPLLGLTPFADHPMVETFGPQAGNPYSPQEYIEMLSYVLEDFTADLDVGTIMDASEYRLVVDAPGRVTIEEESSSARSGARDGAGAADDGKGGVTTVLPVLELLTLREPVTFTIEVSR